MSALTNKQAVHRFARDLAHPGWDRWQLAVNALFHGDAHVQIVHPFNDVGGPLGLLDNFLDPLRRAGARWASVTVEAETAMRADGLSTAIAAAPMPTARLSCVPRSSDSRYSE